MSAVLGWSLLSACLLVSASEGQKHITAECGQNVTLPCQDSNNNIQTLEWSRADLGNQYVFLYRDEVLTTTYQHPSFKDRVDLKDRQMKDGDVSLILKNVTINDTGTYECRVVQKGTNRRTRANLDSDPISIINLSVAPPPGSGGGSVRLSVTLSVFGLLLLVGFVV